MSSELWVSERDDETSNIGDLNDNGDESGEGTLSPINKRNQRGMGNRNNDHV